MNTQNSRKEILSEEIHIKKIKGKCFSWSAVIVGALVGLGVSFLLNLLGISLGLAAFTTSTTTANLTFAIGGFIGLLIISIISMSILGWIAGSLGAFTKINCNKNIIHCNFGCLYGFSAWALALIISVFLSVHVGNFLSYTMASLTNPAIAVERYVNNHNKNYQAPTTASNTAMISNMQTAPVNADDAKKMVTATSLAAFILFLVGAVFASLLGHIAFAHCLRKHGPLN